MNDTDSATATLRDGLKVDPDDDGLRHTAMEFAARGHHERLVDALTPIVASSPGLLPIFADLLEPLSSDQRSGALTAALEAFVGAHTPTSAGAAIVQLLLEDGRTADAGTLIEQLLQEGDPDAAAALRALSSHLESRGRFDLAFATARHATELVPGDHRNRYRSGKAALRALSWGPGHGLDIDLGGLAMSDHHPDPATAAQDLESALFGRPKHLPGVIELARARETVGYAVGAAAAYEHVLRKATRSSEQRVVRHLHEWRFRQERLHARMGHPRVDDPLFRSSLHPQQELLGQGPHAGVAHAYFTVLGLRLEAVIAEDAARTVRILVDDHLLREERLGGVVGAKHLRVLIRRETLARLPQHCTIRLETDQGSIVAVDSWARELRLDVPHGTDELRSRLEGGVTLDKKGWMPKARTEVRADQDSYLDLYQRVRTFLQDELDRDCFILYGTLLGQHRDGDFIPNDDDFDCGYVSVESTPAGVKDETRDLILNILTAGFVVSVNRRGRLFRISDPELASRGIHLDIRPVWFRDGRVWLHNHVSYEASVSEFVPAAHGLLRGQTVLTPRDPERFLAQHYGPGWKVPDPSFTYYADEVDRSIVAELNKALLSPAEFRSWKESYARLAGEEIANRFISVAMQDLYPLGNFID